MVFGARAGRASRKPRCASRMCACTISASKSPPTSTVRCSICARHAPSSRSPPSGCSLPRRRFLKPASGSRRASPATSKSSTLSLHCSARVTRTSMRASRRSRRALRWPARWAARAPCIKEQDMATTMEPTETRVRPSPAPTPAPAEPKKTSSRRRVFMIMGIILVGLLIFGVRKWWFGRSHVSTDNAQVDGHIVPVLPKVGGFVAEVRIEENQSVKAGDTLVVLDDRDLRARLAQTEADLAALLATVSSRGRVGQAEAAVAQAQANVVKARADLARLEP